jgi:hypothetical protein
MARRTVAVLVAGMIWSIASGATAQTTSTSTSTTSTSTSSTTSTSVASTSTTSTTAVHPCTGQLCTADPPMATLSGSGGNARLGPFSACWREMTGESTKCLAASVPLDEPVGLVVRTGETLTLRFDTTMRPSEVVLQSTGNPTALTPANPTTFVADLPVGVYAISFQTKWTQGNVTYRIKVDVRAAPRPLALTG